MNVAFARAELSNVIVESWVDLRPLPHPQIMPQEPTRGKRGRSFRLMHQRQCRRDRCYTIALAITAMVAIIVVVVVLLVPAMIIPVFVTAVITAMTMLFLVTRSVLALVPVVMHKEDPLAAGVVFAAVLVPMFGMARRYAQIDRRAFHRHPLDCYRLTIDHLWRRKAADVESTIEAGVADGDRDSNVGSEHWGSNGDSGNCRCDQKTFHVEFPVASGS